jgi:hypothetical protein
MIAFFALNWIPIWVPITLGVITALMIAKFGTSSVQPQGS